MNFADLQRLAMVVCGIAFFSVVETGYAQSTITEYSAQYRAEYKGRNVGASTFAVRRDEATGHYIYSSTTNTKGLLRFASPKPIIDQSTFSIVDGTIQPIAFMHRDGSRKGEDNHDIQFDWSSRMATVADENGVTQIELPSGVLDRGSLQVALMRDARPDATTLSYVVVDETSLQTYEYKFDGPRTLTTGIGELEVLSFSRQREGSSRKTIIDLAPAMGYVPVRIEQMRDGESRSAFIIESIDN